MRRTPAWLKRRHRNRILVHTDVGTYDGTLMSADRDGVELVVVTFMPDAGDTQKLAGHIYVPADQIHFYQGVPYASPHR